MDKEPLIYSELLLINGDVSFDHITHVTGIQPTKTLSKGETIYGSKLKYRDNIWLLRTPEREVSVEESIRELLEIVSPSVDTILHLVRDHNVSTEVGCVVRMERATPSFLLDRSTVELIAQLRADFNVDIIRTILHRKAG